MILGIGTDLMEIDRIAASHRRYGQRFLDRVYTPAEQAYCLAKRNAAESLTARFAAKEAAAKALGTGISHGVAWPEIEVVRLRSGRPTLQLHGRAAALAQRLGVRHMTISLTHSRAFALAVVIFESDPNAPHVPVFSAGMQAPCDTVATSGTKRSRANTLKPA